MLRLNPDKRINGNIEVLRFLFAYYIAIEHFCLKIPGGLPAVDTFFLVAGFYQMQHMERSSEFAPFRYTWKRFAGMAFLYESSIILLNLFGDEGFGLKQFIGGLYRSIPDMFCLQMSGFSELHVNSPLWFVAGMMVAGLLLALLYAIAPKKFRYLLPVIAILCYASIFHLQGDMDATYYPNSTYPNTYLIPLGTVRAIAGMAVGCMMYLFMKEKAEQFSNPAKRPLFSTLEVVTCLLILYGVFFNHHNHYDFIYVIMLPIFLLCIYSQNTFWANFFNRAGQMLSGLFGKQYTLAVFCFQIFAIRIYRLIFGDAFSDNLGIAILIYALILTIISIFFTKLSELFNKKYLQRA